MSVEETAFSESVERTLSGYWRLFTRVQRDGFGIARQNVRQSPKLREA